MSDLQTYDEWKTAGRQVQKGMKAVSFNSSGKALFHKNQTLRPELYDCWEAPARGMPSGCVHDDEWHHDMDQFHESDHNYGWGS